MGVNTRKQKDVKPNQTSFQKGNLFWRLAEFAGRPLTYTPDQLRQKFIEYCKYIDDNPWKRAEVCKSGDNFGELTEVPVKRPWTVLGFCVYAGITSTTFNSYEIRPEFLEVCRHIQDVVRQQKFEGAAAGFFNAAIIARDLGLVDKQENKVIVSEQPVTKVEIIRTVAEEPKPKKK
jgi:hypothetical protein